MGRRGDQNTSSRLSDAEYFAALEECAAKGNVTASWVLGAAYADGFLRRDDMEDVWLHVRMNRARAEKLLRFVVDSGESGAILTLAGVYKGKKVRKALRLERRAWRMGIAYAANNIAMSYSMLDMPRRCYDWLKRGYAKDRETHAYPLALCHLVGYGTPRDVKKARSLFVRVIDRGWDTQDGREKAALFIKMIDRGEAPNPPRRGRSIGSLRPKARKESD